MNAKQRQRINESALIFYRLGWVTLWIAIALSFSTAFADETKTFTWEIPTERVDGTPMPGSELTRYELGCAATAGADPVVYSEWAVTDPLIATRIESFAPGRWFCVLRIYAVATDGDIASDWGNQVFFSISISPPKAPAGLSVN